MVPKIVTEVVRKDYQALRTTMVALSSMVASLDGHGRSLLMPMDFEEAAKAASTECRRALKEWCADADLGDMAPSYDEVKDLLATASEVERWLAAGLTRGIAGGLR